MPLQNRVHPSGVLVATPDRGMFTGNRGIIHNDQQQVIKKFTLKAWITCSLEYKNMTRKVMSGRHWTELFFLDEATAFAAGHRPCAYCRNADFKKFKSLWLQANKDYFQLEDQQMKTIDIVLHKERMGIMKDGEIEGRQLSSLPDGTIYYSGINRDHCYLWLHQKKYLWDFGGYAEATDDKYTAQVFPLTPPSIIRLFENGYKPSIHGTVANASV